MNRRHVIKGGLAGAVTLWASPLLQAAQRDGGTRKLS